MFCSLLRARVFRRQLVSNTSPVTPLVASMWRIHDPAAPIVVRHMMRYIELLRWAQSKFERGNKGTLFCVLLRCISLTRSTCVVAGALRKLLRYAGFDVPKPNSPEIDALTGRFKLPMFADPCFDVFNHVHGTMG